MKAASLRIVAICLCLAGIGVLPYLVPITHVNMAIEISFFSLYAMSFNMLFGYGGMSFFRPLGLFWHRRIYHGAYV